MNRIAGISLVLGIISISVGMYVFLTSSENYQGLLDFIVLGIFIFLAPIGAQDLIVRKKIREMEIRLPDFLRDVAEASKFGSNLADSITVASDENYGSLTDEIKKMAAQIRWGVSVQEALSEFARRSNSKFITRLVATVIESNLSGGNVSEVLNLIAENSKEIQFLNKEKYSQLGSYVVILVIAYAVFLLTVLILDVQFFPVMTRQLAGYTTSSSLGLLNLSSIPTVKVIFAGVAIIQGVGAGLMAGVLGDGRYRSGLLYAAVLAAVGYIAILFAGGV